jgi:hypothetical protein
MKPELLPSVAKDQLNLVLGFFPRVDSKASVVLAIDTAMLGYLGSKIPHVKWPLAWQLAIPLVAIALIFASIWHLYKTAFPDLKGGDSSLVYFQEIAKRTESRFIDDFAAQEQLAYAKDLLGQAWRNSEILVAKFKHLKYSFIFMALAVIPWTFALIQFSIKAP